MRSREKIDSRRNDGDDDGGVPGGIDVEVDVDNDDDLFLPGTVRIKKSRMPQKNLRTFKTSANASNPRRRRRRLWRVSGDAFDVLVIVVTFLVASEQIVPAASLSCYVCGGATGRPCGEIRYNHVLLVLRDNFFAQSLRVKPHD